MQMYKWKDGLCKYSHERGGAMHLQASELKGGAMQILVCKGDLCKSLKGRGGAGQILLWKGEAMPRAACVRVSLSGRGAGSL